MKPKTKKINGMHGLEKAFLLNDASYLDSRWHELELRKLQAGKKARTGDLVFDPAEIKEKYKDLDLDLDSIRRTKK